MPIAGDLAQVPLPQVLEMLQQQGRAGLLTIAAGAKETTLYFDREAVRVFSVNGQKAMRIGDVLLEHERVTEFQLKHALERQAETKQRLGEILVDLGLVMPDEIEQAMHTQAEEEIFEIFSLRDGQFRFAERELAESEYRPDPTSPDHAFPVEQLVTEVARRVAEWQSLASGFRGDGDVFVVPPEHRTATLKALPDGAPKRMAELLNGTNTLGDLVHRLLLPRYKIYRTLAELVRDGHTRQASAAELRETARKLKEDKQVKQAVKLLEHAFATAPDDAAVVQELAEIHEAVGDKKRAGGFYKALADIHFNGGAPDQGALVCAKVLEFLPSDPYPHERLVEHYIARDQRGRALESARTLLRLYQHNGEIDRASELCRSFLEMFPEDVGLHERMVNLHLAAGRQGEAVGEYEAMAELVGKDGARDSQARDRERLEIFQKVLLIDKGRDDIRRLVEQLSGTADAAVVARRRARRRWLVVAGCLLLVLALGAGLYEMQARSELGELRERLAALGDDSAENLLVRIKVREDLHRGLAAAVGRYGFSTVAADAEAEAAKLLLLLSELKERHKANMADLESRFKEADRLHREHEFDAADQLCDTIVERDYEGTWRQRAQGLKRQNGEQRRRLFDEWANSALDAAERRIQEAGAALKRAGAGSEAKAAKARQEVLTELASILGALTDVLAKFEGASAALELKTRAERLRDGASAEFHRAVLFEAKQRLADGDAFMETRTNLWERAQESYHLAWIMLGSDFMAGNTEAADLSKVAAQKRDAIDTKFGEARALDAQRLAALEARDWHTALALALQLNRQFVVWPEARNGDVKLHLHVESTPAGAAVWRQGADRPEGLTPCTVDYAASGATMFVVRLPGFEDEPLRANGTAGAVALTLKKTWLARVPVTDYGRPAGPGRPAVPGRLGDVVSTPVLVDDRTLVAGGRVRRLQWIDLQTGAATREYSLQELGNLRAPPQLQDGWLYLTSTNNDLCHRVRAAPAGTAPAGSEWRSERLPSAPVGPPLLGADGAPVVVVCARGQLLTLLPETGEVLARRSLPSPPAGPAVRSAAGVFVVGEDQRLRCVDPGTGAELASVALPVRPSADLQLEAGRLAVPVGDEVWVYAAEPGALGRAPLQCVGAGDEVRSCTFEGSRLWFATVSGRVGAWNLRAAGEPEQPPVPLPGTNPAPPLRVADALVVGMGSGDVVCCDVATLDVRWHVKVGGAVVAAPLAWRDRVLVPCTDGHVYVFVR